MNRQTLLGLAGWMGTGAVVALLIASETAPLPAGSPTTAVVPGTVGRYQVARADSASPNTCWVIDTTDGHLWYHFQGGGSQDQGLPPYPVK
jgi:hypothetical protein